MTRSPIRFAVRSLVALVAVAGLAGGCSSGGSDGLLGAGDDTTTTSVDPLPAETTTSEDRPDATTTTAPSAEAQEYIDAFIESFGDADGEFFTDEQVTCTMTGWVSFLTVERFQASDISPESITDDTSDPSDLDLTKAEAGQLVDIMVDCKMDLRRGMVLGMIEDEDLTAEQEECVDEAFTQELAEDLYGRSLQGDNSGSDKALEILDQCRGDEPAEDEGDDTTTTEG